MDAREGSDEHRKALGSLIHGHQRKVVALTVLGFLLHTLLVLHIVQAGDAVEGCPDRQLVAFLLGMEHQHHTVHAVVLSARKVLGKGC